MLESLLVASIVAVAVVYAAWALTPATVRNSLALRLARALGGPEAGGVRGRLAAMLHRLAKAPVGGCNNCPANTLTPAERAKARQPDKP
jgi:hypothetical protein